jgi:hypothetical protein
MKGCVKTRRAPDMGHELPPALGVVEPASARASADQAATDKTQRDEEANRTWANEALAMRSLRPPTS